MPLPPLANRKYVVYVSPDSGKSWVRVTRAVGARAAVTKRREIESAGYDRELSIRVEIVMTQKEWRDYYAGPAAVRQPDLFS